MKTKAISTLIIIFIFCACSTAQKNIQEDRVISTLKQFYTEYLTASDLPFSAFSDGSGGWVQNLRDIQQRYATQRLLNHIDSLRIHEDLNFDVFIQAQDSWIGWLDNMVIKKDGNGENQYSVFIWHGYEYGFVRIRMVVVEEDSKIKINELLNIYNIEYVDVDYFEIKDENTESEITELMVAKMNEVGFASAHSDWVRRGAVDFGATALVSGHFPAFVERIQKAVPAAVPIIGVGTAAAAVATPYLLARLAARGFRAWFILQHFRGYRPFITVMERDFPIGKKN
jgi:hypothetical protein